MEDRSGYGAGNFQAALLELALEPKIIKEYSVYVLSLLSLGCAIRIAANVPIHYSMPSTTHRPSSIPTFLHQGVLPSPPTGALTTLSTSPTWRLGLISLVLPFKPFNFIARPAIVRLIISRVNPWDAFPPKFWMEETVPFHSSLMTGRCHCSGSDELDKRLRWRYTSVP